MYTHWIHTGCKLFVLFFFLSPIPIHGLFSSIFSGSGDGEKKGGVVDLSEDIFDEIVRKEEDVLVVLFQVPGQAGDNPYSGTKCMLETASKALKKSRVIFGVVDTQSIARREGATETGTIHIYKSGQKVIYQGQPSGQTLAAFVSKMLQPAIHKVGDDEDEVDDLDELVSDLKEVDLPTAIGYFNSSSTEYQKYQETAVRWQAFVEFYAIFNSKAAETLGLTTEGSVYLYQPFRKTTAVLNLEKVTSDKEIDTFINKHKHYVLHKLSPSETQKFLTVKKGSTQIFTFLDTDRSDGRSFFTLFRRVVKQLSKGVWDISPILWIEPDEFSMLMEDIKDQYDINWKIPVTVVISGENKKGTWLDMSVLNKLPCEASRYMALYSWIEAAASGLYSNKYRNTGLTTQPLPQSQVDFLCTFPFEDDEWEEEEDEEETSLPTTEETDKKKLRETKYKQNGRKTKEKKLDRAKDYEIYDDRETQTDDEDDEDTFDSWKEKDGGKKELRSRGHPGGDDPDFPGGGDGDGGDGNREGLDDPDQHHMGTLFGGDPDDNNDNNDENEMNADGNDDENANQNNEEMEQPNNDEDEGSPHTPDQDQGDKNENKEQKEETKLSDRFFEDDEDIVQLLQDDNDAIVDPVNVEEDKNKTELSKVEEERKEPDSNRAKQKTDRNQKKQEKPQSNLFDDDDDSDAMVNILPDEGPINDFWLQFEAEEQAKQVKKKQVIDLAEDIVDHIEKAGMGEAIEDNVKEQENFTDKQEVGKQEKEIVKQKPKIQTPEAEKKKQENEDEFDFLKEKKDERLSDTKETEETNVDKIQEIVEDRFDPSSAEPVITISDDYDLNTTEEKKASVKKAIKFHPAPVYKFPNQPNYETEDMYEILCGNFLDGQIYSECGKKQRRKELKEALQNSKDKNVEN